MDKFNEKEKRTILQLLTMIMEADTVIDTREIDYINTLLNDFGLTFAEFDHMDMLDFEVLKDEFCNMTKDKRDSAKIYFEEMANVDGNVHVNEMNLINKLCCE